MVRKLLTISAEQGVGYRYLILHSAGSGKSNSIAWLTHQLIGLTHVVPSLRDGETEPRRDSATWETEPRRDSATCEQPVFDTIIITTVQKFPFILDEIGSEHRGRRFAIIIDEAHSSQGGKTSVALNRALEANPDYPASEEEETTEDKINRIMAGRKMLPNANYYGFTATPKNKTLEIFGQPFDEDGETKHRPFHCYTMKQAIQEGFILDVLKHYTSIASYYKLVKAIESDPEFDTKRAKKKLRRYVEGHEHAIRLKAEIMVDHFQEQVIGLKKIGGQLPDRKARRHAATDPR